MESTSKPKDLKYKIGLSLIPNIGCILAKRLISYTGSVEAVFNEKKSHLLKIPGIGEYIAQSIIKQNVLNEAEKEIDFINRNRVRVVFYLDKTYPTRLKQCEDAPLNLYMLGTAELQFAKMLSIVGTRNATDYGKELCRELIRELGERHSDISIISGLAYGVDICAHKQSLALNVPTIAVLGHGLNMIYPSLHKSTAQKIVKNGLLLTEFTSNTKLEPNNFVRRNRIIAGLSDAVVVIESGKKGGALITADLANSYNRDVFAFPGRIKDLYSTGCNYLIKTNRAALIESVNDLEYIMGWEKTEQNTKGGIQRQLFQELSDDEIRITDLLREMVEATFDQIYIATQMPMSKIAALLLNLELKGLIKCKPGKRYCNV